MRMLDVERKQAVRVAQLYLTPDEARELVDSLARLLVDPEANEHTHVTADSSRDLSVSIITRTKLANLSRYTKLERQVFAEE